MHEFGSGRPGRYAVGLAVTVAVLASSGVAFAEPQTSASDASAPPAVAASASSAQADASLLPSPSSDPKQDRDDAVLLGTLLGARHRLSWSLGNLGAGVATGATSGTWTGISAIYMANGGSIGNAAAPLLFGAGGLCLGIYQIAAGGDLASVQLGFARAWERGDSPRALLDTFEPQLREASYRAQSRRHWFAGISLALAALSAGAGAILIASPPDELRGGTYPAVMIGLGAINALAGLTTLLDPTPTETAWHAYVTGTSR